MSHPALPLSGGCQCGAVRYLVTGAPGPLYACHCNTCRRQSGSAFGLSLRLAQDDLEVTGQVASFMRVAPSGQQSRCTFCPDCGTRLWHARDPATGSLVLKPGTLDRSDWLTPVAHIWTAEKLDWVTIPDGVQSWPGQPDMAALSRL